MSKKNQRKHRNGERAGAIAEPQHAPHGSDRKPIFFAVGDADYGYTEGKILRLAQRFQNQTNCNLVVLTHDVETIEGAKKLGLQSRLVAIESPGITVEERLKSTDEMIRETADLAIPRKRSAVMESSCDG